MNIKDSLDWLEGHEEIKSLRAAVCDLNGVMRGKRIPLEQAEKVLKAVLEKFPNEVDVLTTLGDLAGKRGDLVAADGFYERALAIAPDHWDALAPLVDHLVKEGQGNTALARLETFVNRDAPYDGRGALEQFPV